MSFKIPKLYNKSAIQYFEKILEIYGKLMRLIGTRNKSYIPSLIAVNIRGTGTTAQNIKVSEFGVNLAPEDQNILCSLTGRYSGKHLDKVA